ncbi:hypothetical protein B0H13DRAFT_2470623 [Mycena leptocephala]|nr:hypothetical protein B0H13DRAFT_2470623 [Mycena leptocephala]
MLTHFFFSFLFSPDRLERFAVYRRDVGDTLVNAYYILWDDLLVFLVAEAEAAAAGVERVRGMWETLEAPSTASAPCTRRSTSIRCPLSPPGPRLDEGRGLAALGRLFGGRCGEGCLALFLFQQRIMGRMRGIQGQGGQGQGQGEEGEALAVQRLRRTALGLVGAFFLPPPLPVHATNTPLRRTDTCAGYFTTRAPNALLPLLQYVLGALADADGGFVWWCVFL